MSLASRAEASGRMLADSICSALRRLIAVPYVAVAKRSDRPLAAEYARDFAAADLWDRVRRRNAHLPPRRLRFVGAGDFEQIGQHFRDHLVTHAGLVADSQVLDIGCGIGRMALPLTTTLGSDGSYDGFDVVDEAIRWCRRNITRRHPNFHFTTLEVRNGVYRPHARVAADAVCFPYANLSFDVVLVASVFTHMEAPAVENYLREIGRVVRPGGRAFVTVFLLDDDSRRSMHEGASAYVFTVPVGEHAMTADASQPELAVALDSEWFSASALAAGLEPDGGVRTGAWRRSESGVDFQDFVVLRRNAG